MRRSHAQVGSLTRWFVRRAPMLLLACLVGCGVWPSEPPITLLPGDLCSAFPSTAIPTFEDDNVRWAVTAGLGLSQQDDLTCGLVAGVTTFFARHPFTTSESLLGMQNLTNLTTFQTRVDVLKEGDFALDLSPLSGLTRLEIVDLHGQDISDISALAGLTNLTELNLEFNWISDISALSELTNLTELILWANEISDITPLSGLTSLTTLNLDAWNEVLRAEQGLPPVPQLISDISALSRLTSLVELRLGDHGITDISALSGLTSLVDLNLDGNEITDVSALSGLTSLAKLDLWDNSALSDITPLLANPGLGAGDEVDLRGTDVSCSDVARLQSKGVTVETTFC